MIFGGTATVERYKGNPRVQAHGPGFSKILLGDDVVDRLGEVSRPDGRQRLPQQRPRLHQLLRHLGLAAHAGNRRGARRTDRARSKPLPPDDPKPAWPRSPCPGQADGDLEARSKPTCKEAGVTDMTAKYGPRLVEKERCDYLRPTVVHCESPDSADRQEGIHVPVRHRGRMPAGQDARDDRADAGLHGDHRTTRSSQRQLIDATHIDRLNLGPIPTIKLNWLQPHEGNIVDFLFRARAYQLPQERLALAR